MESRKTTTRLESQDHQEKGDFILRNGLQLYFTEEPKSKCGHGSMVGLGIVLLLANLFVMFFLLR